MVLAIFNWILVFLNLSWGLPEGIRRWCHFLPGTTLCPYFVALPADIEPPPIFHSWGTLGMFAFFFSSFCHFFGCAGSSPLHSFSLVASDKLYRPRCQASQFSWLLCCGAGALGTDLVVCDLQALESRTSCEHGLNALHYVGSSPDQSWIPCSTYLGSSCHCATKSWLIFKIQFNPSQGLLEEWA